MKVCTDDTGLKLYSYQAPFPEEVECECGGKARYAFIAHEHNEDAPVEGHPVTPLVCEKHDNDPRGTGFWVHDNCSVAVYFCRDCLKPVARMTQA